MTGAALARKSSGFIRNLLTGGAAASRMGKSPDEISKKRTSVPADEVSAWIESLEDDKTGIVDDPEMRSVREGLLNALRDDFPEYLRMLTEYEKTDGI